MMAPALDFEKCGLTEAKDHFSALTAQANSTGRPFTVLKGGRPWVEVRPLAVQHDERAGEIRIAPVRRTVAVADLDDVFAGYDGDWAPQEDWFSQPAGSEEL